MNFLTKREIVKTNWGGFFMIEVYKQNPTDPNFDPDVDDTDELNGDELGTHRYELYELFFNKKDLIRSELIDQDRHSMWGVDTCLENAKHEIDLLDPK